MKDIKAGSGSRKERGKGGWLQAGALILLFIAGFPCATQALSAPVVLYTDILSGPTTGGEGGNGIYLSIFGMNFGTEADLGTKVRVKIGGAGAASYLYLGRSKGRPDIRQITVQVGGNPTQGIPLPIQVIVDGVGSNTDHTFMPNPGNIYFVDNESGNDSTGAAGDITKPYRHVQVQNLDKAAWGQTRPGDFIVMRGNGNPWTDVGFVDDDWGYFMRYRDKSGCAPKGKPGTGPITIMGYPGEDVFIHGTLRNGMDGGCISAINGETYQYAGRWAVITSLRINGEGYDGPVNLQIHGDNWRVINNDLSASNAPRTGDEAPRMGGITGTGNNSVWLGNHIHDIQGGKEMCHGFYIDGGRGYEIAYNNVHDIRDGNGFQIYGNYTDDVHFHHNWVHDVSKFGLNIADGSRNNITIHDNIIFNIQLSGVRFNTEDLHNCRIYNNTFYNVNMEGREYYAVLRNTGYRELPADAVDICNNIFWPRSGTTYQDDEMTGHGTIIRNLWYGGTDTMPDSDPVTGNPGFVSPGTDFRLQAGSPAIDAGSNAVAGLVTDDYTTQVPRPAGAGYDIGACEYKAAGSTGP